MKWTPEQVKQLTNACMIGTSNADMAKFFGVSVQEIHAKRSALGITIPKVVEKRASRQAQRLMAESQRDYEHAIASRREENHERGSIPPPPFSIPAPPAEPRINPETLKKLADVCDAAGISLDTAVRWVALMVRLLADEKAEREVMV